MFVEPAPLHPLPAPAEPNVCSTRSPQSAPDSSQKQTHWYAALLLLGSSGLYGLGPVPVLVSVLEELHCAFVFLRLLATVEGAQVLPFTSAGIFLTGIQSILSRL